MGCFLSTNNKQPTTLPLSKSPPHTHTHTHTNTLSLPEETVKEVLTETEKPNISSPFIKSAPLLTHLPLYDDFSEHASVKTTFSDVSSSAPDNHRTNSPAKTKNRNFSGERERTPLRSSEPSPGRIRPGTKPESKPGSGRRRESGESSGRRSRSPVTRLECGSSKIGLGSGRSQSNRKTGKVSGRVGYGSGSVSGSVKRVGEDVDEKWLPPTNNNNNNELIENPLVSLECFIFL